MPNMSFRALAIVGAFALLPLCVALGTGHAVENMSLGALWERLNDPRRTDQTNIEAIMVAVRTGGLAALNEPANIQRLGRCDAQARAEINRRIASLRETKNA